jgi:arsenite-transporting ATPase
VRHLLDRQILFFGGKGGVGKTTCAAAVALAASRSGRRVLLVSTDPAHSTSDVLGIAVGPREQEILPSLFAMEIDAASEARDYVAGVKERAKALFGNESAVRAMTQIDIAASMPGIEDAALFDRISRLVLEQTGRYDIVVFDTPPTGHTLPLLRMPDAMVTWLRALAESRRAMLSDDRRGDDTIIGAIEERVARLQQFRGRLTSRATAAFALVVIPERLPIDETARAAEQLAETSIDIAAVIVNQVVPASATGEFIEARRAQERVHLQRIERVFAGHRRAYVPQRASDVHGLADLEAIASALFA